MDPFYKTTALTTMSAIPSPSTTPVIGVYGISDTQVAALLKDKRCNIDPGVFDVYDQRVQTQLGGNEHGLVRYRASSTKDDAGKRPSRTFRADIMDKVVENTRDRGCPAVVDLRYMTWDERWWASQKRPSEQLFEWAKEDVRGFTHIIFLDASEDDVARLFREERDRNERDGSRVPKNDLGIRIQQRRDKLQLRTVCLQAGVIFTVVTEYEVAEAGEEAARRMECLTHLAFDPRYEASNTASILKRLQMDICNAPAYVETVLVVDADRTLGGEAISNEFWQKYKTQHTIGNKQVFDAWGRQWQAFLQVLCLFGEIPVRYYRQFCEDKIKVWSQNPERNPLQRPFARFLKSAAEFPWVHVTVLTCGVEAVLRQLLMHEGWSENVTVIGTDSSAMHVVTPPVKRKLVNRLKKDRAGTLVWTFGNDVLDVDMMCAADKAFMVAGTETSKTQYFDFRKGREKLRKAMERRRCSIQVLIPPGYSLGTEDDWVQLDDNFQNSVLERQSKIIHRIGY